MEAQEAGLFPPCDWYVAFTHKCVNRRTRMVPGKWKHVFAMGATEEGMLIFDPDWEQTRFSFLRNWGAINEIVGKTLADGEILFFGPAEPVGRFPFAPFTCVSAVKHLLGIRSSALRPTSLRRHLLAQGCKPIGEANG